MRLLQFIAALVAALTAAAIGMVFPAVVEEGLLPGPVVFLAGVGLLCILAYGLSLISTPEG